MDKDRQIRFLIPPFFLLAALLWGAYLSGQLYPFIHALDQGSEGTALKLGLSMLGIVGLTTLPVGYAIGVITILTLRFLGLCRLSPGLHHSYEMPLSEVAVGKIRLLLGASKIDPKLDLCVCAAFDHAYVHSKIHDWQVRRWNAFNIAAQCVTALLLSVPFAHAFHIQVFSCLVWRWWVTIAVFIGLFVWQSAWTWRECRLMFEFSAEVPTIQRPKSSIRARSQE
jgi:hypothetical protein